MEKYYYHVVTERPMHLGQIITFDNNNHSGVYNRVMDKLEIVKDIISNPDKYKQSELDHHTKVALRELALEQVRKEKYPNYPSRLESLYVSKNIEDAEMWANSFIAKDRQVFQIVKLKTDGNEFTGDAYNCFEGSIDEQQNILNSYNYWDNKDNNTGNKPIWETLINGNIEVIEIIKDFSKKNTRF